MTDEDTNQREGEKERKYSGIGALVDLSVVGSLMPIEPQNWFDTKPYDQVAGHYRKNTEKK